MRSLKSLIAALTIAAACGLASPARACPLCKEAAESAVDASSENYDDDPLAEARAYNRSIYMMIGVPYTIFAVGGFYCYRHLRGRCPNTGARQP
jgi:hypothetical protein